jgi:PadR family transcriptional regulator, regulatory protein PadR
MTTRRAGDERVSLLQGTLDLLILRLLVFGPQHGQGIAGAIEQQSDEALLVDHGSHIAHAQHTRRCCWAPNEGGEWL